MYLRGLCSPDTMTSHYRPGSRPRVSALGFESAAWGCLVLVSSSLQTGAWVRAGMS